MVDLIGQVSLLGIAELSGVSRPTETVQVGERWLQVELLGEVNRATSAFQRGVGSYPGLDDPVHFATSGDLRALFLLRPRRRSGSEGWQAPTRSRSASTPAASSLDTSP